MNTRSLIIESDIQWRLGHFFIWTKLIKCCLNLNLQGYEPKASTLSTVFPCVKISNGVPWTLLQVKLWNTQSGFCFVTFHEHTSSVTAVTFANNRKFLVSASLDGTVRAFDMVRCASLFLVLCDSRSIVLFTRVFPQCLAYIFLETTIKVKQFQLTL